MEDKIQKSITCKKCGKTHEFDIYPIINFQNKELVDKTFSLELFRYKCPDCESIAIVQYDTIIIDLFKKNLIYLYTNNDLNIFYNEILPGLNQKLNETDSVKKIIQELKHTRVVSSLNELLEKLLIFDYDLDDRVVEIMKYSLLKHKNLENFNVLKIYFDKLEKDKLLFTCIGKNNTTKGISVDIKHYNLLIDNCKIIPETPNLDFNKVDDLLIENIMKEKEKEQ